MAEIRANYSIEAEMATLGSMICSYDAACDAVASSLRAEHFFRPAHRTMFSVLKMMTELEIPIDPTNFEIEMSHRGALESIGGPEYLYKCVEFIDGPSGVLYCAMRVKQNWQRRQIHEAAMDLARLCTDPDRTLEEVLATVSSMGDSDACMSRRTPFMALGDIDTGEDDSGVSTGFEALDGAISTNGYPRGQMSVVRAYHKGGKSAFMVSSFIRLAKAGYRVGYATFADLNAKQLKRRVMKSETGWGKYPDSAHFQTDYDLATTDIKENWEAFVYDASKQESGSDVETFTAWLTATHKKKPFDAFFVDYAQEISSSDKKATTEVSEQNIVASKMNRCAAKNDLAIIVGSQITEGQNGEKAKTKYSRAWEEKAGWVLTLKREDETKLNVEITYSRFGKQDVSFGMTWNGARVRVED